MAWDHGMTVRLKMTAAIQLRSRVTMGIVKYPKDYSSGGSNILPAGLLHPSPPMI